MSARCVVLSTVVGLLVAACGSPEGRPVLAGAGDGVSAVTAAGADSAITERGDSRPDGETETTSLVRVSVELPAGADIAGIVIVALEDISLADTPAVEITRMELSVAQLVSQSMAVELFTPVPLDGSIDVTATVHIDVDENGAFSQGDWISPNLASVGPGPGSAVSVTMVQI